MGSGRIKRTHQMYLKIKWNHLCVMTLKVKVIIAQSCPTLQPMDWACQILLFVEFSRQEYWRGLPFPSPGDFSDPGIEPGPQLIPVFHVLSNVAIFIYFSIYMLHYHHILAHQSLTLFWGNKTKCFKVQSW